MGVSSLAPRSARPAPSPHFLLPDPQVPACPQPRGTRRAVPGGPCTQVGGGGRGLGRPPAVLGAPRRARPLRPPPRAPPPGGSGAGPRALGARAPRRRARRSGAEQRRSGPRGARPADGEAAPSTASPDSPCAPTGRWRRTLSRGSERREPGRGEPAREGWRGGGGRAGLDSDSTCAAGRRGPGPGCARGPQATTPGTGAGCQAGGAARWCRDRAAAAAPWRQGERETARGLSGRGCAPGVTPESPPLCAVQARRQRCVAGVPRTQGENAVTPAPSRFPAPRVPA